MPQNAITPIIILYVERQFKRRAGNIAYPTALYAPNMVMTFWVTVKSGFRGAGVQLLYLARLGQQFQIAINGSQADFWEPMSHDSAECRCGGV